ncbi:MAG: PIN domain-containing protein [Lentisphaeria bacterium]|nr:PIN domain-containing protein [Lentisphaeria bacterium]
MPLIDANIVLRHLLNDHPEMSPEAEKILDKNDVELRYEVLCEVVYVLSKLYKVPRELVCSELKTFIQADSVFIPEQNAAEKALELYRDEKIDFVDAILCSYAQVQGDTVLTFDKKMLELLKNSK